MVEEADSAAGPRTPPPSAVLQPDHAPVVWGPDDDGAAADSDDDVTDLTSDPNGPAPDSPKHTAAAIRTAKCLIDCNVHWDGAEVEGAAADPCLAAVELHHVARQSADTSRWWTVRWPPNAVSLVGRAGALSPGKTWR